MNFCTLFDSYYIHKGIALYLSLERVARNFHLYVMAFDQETYKILKECQFKHMTVEFVEDFEDDELRRIKKERKRNEYCWTCGSNITYFFMQKYSLPDITYIDADMMFFSSPDTVLSELEDSSVALSPHFTDNKYFGKYCVQFVYFKNDERGRKALTWWKDRCREWCYDRYEDGKFGDQRYLDQMPALFDGIHAIENRGIGVAKWNMNEYQFLPDHRIKHNEKIYNVCFFHYHSIGVDYNDGTITIESKKDTIPEDVIKYMFVPYGELMKEVYEKHLGKTVARIQYKNPNYLRRAIQTIKNVVRDNKIVQYVFFKYIKGHSGYNKKQV